MGAFDGGAFDAGAFDVGAVPESRIRARRTMTILIDVNIPRKSTPLQEWREGIETRTQEGQGPAVIPGDGFLDYCPLPLPGAAPLVVDLDALLDALGIQVGEIDNGEVVLYDSLNPNPVLLATAARDTNSEFTTPTPALRVTDVWFDSLHADPEDMWQFIAPNTITTTEPLPSSILVQVLYVGGSS